MKSTSLWRGLKPYRESRGVLSKDLAARMSVSASYLSEIENGKRPLSDSFLSRLAESYQVDESALQKSLDDLSTDIPPDRMMDEPAPYAWRTPDPIPEEENPIEVLCLWFASQLGREKLFDLVVKFTEEAKAGDVLASKRARALLSILERL